MQKYTVYYDEAWRGPLAGSVFVWVTIKLWEFDDVDFDDSKKLTEKKRFWLFDRIEQLEKDGLIMFWVGSASAESIDNDWIVGWIKIAISKWLVNMFTKAWKLPDDVLSKSFWTQVKFILTELVDKMVFDGNTDFWIWAYIPTETIIKGDWKVKMIGMSSIIAKTGKDLEMIALSKKKEEGLDKYGFEDHKWYWTKKHMDAIKTFGLSPVHRKTFCKKLI